MSNDTVKDIDIEKDIDNDEGFVMQSGKLPDASSEMYGTTPLVDRFGRDLRIRTRMCFCSTDAETDCRFHSQKEVGWEECPSLELAKKNPNVKGRWLWARNPNYGKPPTEEEQKLWNIEASVKKDFEKQELAV
jgi:hypothetical protein